MSDQKPVDKHLRCASCGDGFIFSAGEQELHRLRGIAAEPQNCPTCTRHGEPQIRIKAYR